MTEELSFAAAAEPVRAQIGFRLFTVLGWVPQRRALRRLWSSNPTSYAMGGEKTTQVDPAWLRARVEDQEPFLGADFDAVRGAFRDHALIQELGCGAVLNTTVIERGHTLAVLSVLDVEGAYDPADLARLIHLTPAFLPAVRNATSINTPGD